MTIEIEKAPVRRRPRNRRQMIVDAAGPIFSERGYHGASMEDVAAKVDITAAALYRHFPNKYALFAECANRMVDRLLEVVEEEGADASAAQLFAALAEVTVEHRASGGLYRWEARYLEAPERHELRGKFGRVVEATEAVLAASLGGAMPRLRASAALGAIGSVSLHRTPLARQRLVDLLVDAAGGVAAVDPEVVLATASRVQLRPRLEPVSRRAEILQAAIPLFALKGFHNVSMGEIAAEVGLGPSAMYRHYPAKADILAAACLQAAALLEQSVGQVLDGVSGPQESLRALAAAHVSYTFENTALISVAEAEIVGLPPELRRPVMSVQREHVALWEQKLAEARPELDGRMVRTLVHSGFGAVVEAGRLLRWHDTAENQDVVTALMLGALGVN